MRTPALIVMTLALLTAAARGQGGGWTTLFDGSTLNGWTTTLGGDISAWAVENGEITNAKPGQGGWLRTQRMYRDFELEVEFQIPKDGNSGVGLRCSSNGDPAFTGLEVQIYDSFKQPPSRTACGAVYNAIAPESQAVKAPGEWNTYRIRLVDDTLDVWLNGTHVQKGQKLDNRGIFRRDDQPMPLAQRMPTGYIAFQDHGQAGLRLRNIRVKDLSPDPDPGTLVHAFNQRDTQGWTHRGGGRFIVEDGTLMALDGPGHLFSEGTHTDIELRALVRIAKPEETGADRPGNSGIYFRTVPRPEDPDTWPLGYEAQIDNNDTRSRNYTGCVYDKATAKPGRPITEDGVWFDYRILAVGDRVRTWINGEPMVDARLDEFKEGHVAFQTHHKGNRIEFRDIRWRAPLAGE